MKSGRNQPIILPWLKPRGLNHREAAGYCGLSVSSFDGYRRRGVLPNPTLPSKRYDKVLLDQAMNKHSGIADASMTLSPLEHWRQRRGANEF